MQVCLFRELPVAFVAGIQEIFGSRVQEAPASPEQPCFLPLRLCTVEHNTACRVSLFGFIMDISKLLNYWRETRVSEREELNLVRLS